MAEAAEEAEENKIINHSIENTVTWVDGHPIDTMYLKLERNGQIDTFLLLRPDEMAAIGWLVTGVLWSLHMDNIED